MHKRTERTKTHRMGMVAVLAGMLIAFVGVLVTPADAKTSGGSITICHRTNSPHNPYRRITVSSSAADGSLQGPDHTGHGGPAFDYSADPADPGYPYTTPRNGDQWGDIIPPYAWEGGSYPGSDNWTDGGEAIWTAQCNQAPTLCADRSVPVNGQCPEDDVCPNTPGIQESTSECPDPVDVCPDVAGVQTSTTECPDPVDVCPDVAGVQTSTTECPAPQDVCPDVAGVQTSTTECPAPQDVCPNVAGVQTDAALCPVVEGNVVTPTPGGTQVEGVSQSRAPQVAAAELPRTGKSTLPLVELGFGLVLLGVGALIFARDEALTA